MDIQKIRNLQKILKSQIKYIDNKIIIRKRKLEFKDIFMGLLLNVYVIIHMMMLFQILI